jgi:K+-transporting ATPase ATPase C chain
MLGMWQQIRPAIVLFVLLSITTGIVYPLLVTAAAHGLFPRQAAGSLVDIDGRPIGSDLIGQAFADPRHFWGRPSATSPVPYNASAGSGSNLGPTNPALVDAVRARVAALRAADPANRDAVPIDLVTASASGLDPHISPAAAYYQVPRVAKARGLSEAVVREVVDRHVESPAWGVFGAARVNVLRLNLALESPRS